MGNKHSSSPEVAVGVASSSSIPPTNTNLLHGCSTLEEHNEIIRHVISSSSSSIGGEEQLKALGFEYRFLPCCSAHASHDIINDNSCHQCATRLFYVGRQGQRKRKEDQRENKHVDAQDLIMINLMQIKYATNRRMRTVNNKNNDIKKKMQS